MIGTMSPVAENHRERIVRVASDLLRTSGQDAVSTRAVSAGAGVQAPTIYRIFGDKRGLLNAVAAAGFLAYVESNNDVSVDGDPIDGLRAGWDLHIAFGLANPYLYSLIYGEPQPGETSQAALAAAAIIESHIHRIAQAGLLRVSEARAVDLVQAAGRGTTLTLIAAGSEDASLARTAREAVISAITLSTRASEHTGPTGAALVLRAALPVHPLSENESSLLGDWLDRIAEPTSR